MSKDPAILFYYRDFLHGTRRFTREQRGLYIELLCEQADSNTGSISEDDMKFILGGCDESISAPVLKKFTTDTQGYFNKKLREVIDKRKMYSESRRRNREKKKEDINNICETHDEHMGTHMANANADEIRDKKERGTGKTIIEKVREFYQEEFKKGEGKDHYIAYCRFVGIIFNEKYENPLGEPMVHILKIPKQVTYTQYENLSKEAKLRGVKILDLLDSMINKPNYVKDAKSLYLTLLNWIKRREIQGTNH